MTDARLRPQNTQPLRSTGKFVLYWMTAARRTRWNFSLQRALTLGAALQKPVVVLEALRLDYPDASPRFHTFIVEGMAVNAAAFAKAKVAYYPYVERRAGEGKGLLEALAASACVVVADWFPAFFLPRMLESAARRLDVRLEAIDGNGLIPVAAHGRAFPTARGYRAFMQRTLREHLRECPLADPLATIPRAGRAVIPRAIRSRWPSLTATELQAPGRLVASLPLSSSIPAVDAKGGQDAAARLLRQFIEHKLERYGDEHNDPDADCTSRLSPYLHFGHISVHEVFSELMTRERWTTRKIGKTRAGAREGWWGVSLPAEHFLDQIAVWRDLAFNGCALTPGYERYDTLPPWARATLESHLDDPRSHIYSLAQLDAAETHDPLWNAAQRQLRAEGWFHGYMRMLWGKKILEWSTHPADALEKMERLMNRYSLDGRDPVSHLNYGWVLGRYDRPWPERPIFGTVRYMSSESARRKLRVREYLKRWAAGSG